AAFRRASARPDASRAGIARAAAAMGRRHEARVVLDGLVHDAQVRYVSPELVAGVFAQLGDRDSAFEWLARAYDARSPALITIKLERRWDPLRGDVRFETLLHKLNLE